jgi:outer membrane protein assembly factor BamB
MNKENLEKTNRATAIVLLVLLIFSLAAGVSTINANTLTETIAYLSCQPTVTGLGQYFLVNAWIVPPPSFDSAGKSILYQNLTFVIKAPDGTSETVGGITSEPSGSTWFEWTVNQVGTYSVVFSYPGDANHTAASSPPSYVKVQSDPVKIGAPPVPLPTGAWSRPINAQNREWASISGNWPSAGWCQHDLADSCYNPYSLAPNTAHILWRQPTQIGGLVGGTKGSDYYGGSPTEAIIMAGRAYFVVGSTINCIDLKTGMSYWAVAGSGTLLGEEGADTGITGSVGSTPYIWAITAASWTRYNAFTGAVARTLTGIGTAYGSQLLVGIDQTSTAVVGSSNQGSTTTGPYIYVSASNGVDATQYLKVDLAKSGTTVAALVAWNYTFSGKGLSDPVYGTALRKTTVLDDVFVPQGNAPFSLGFNATTGELLYNVTRSDIDETRGAAGYGMIYGAIQTGGVVAYNMRTGALVWKNNPTQYPWGEFTGYALGVAYNKVYQGTYDGHVYAYNAQTGKAEWSYYAGNTTWTPYGTFPFYAKPCIADGKVYLGTSEHSPTQPFIEGFRLYCLDANNGSLIWSVSGSYNSAAIADGVLVTTNMYDGMMYGFGKGSSAMSVSAPQTAISQGQPVMITGKILDTSAAEPNTPCVSDASMSDWMQYLQMQYPKPTNTTGVPVHLTATDPNGNFQDLGTAVSNDLGNYALAYIPPVPGLYTITASFEGSNSYYGSQAGTSFIVSKASAATPEVAVTPVPTQAPTAVIVPTQAPTATIAPTPIPVVIPPTSSAPTTTYIAIGVAVIVIIAVAAALILRRRK